MISNQYNHKDDIYDINVLDVNNNENDIDIID